MNKVFQLTVVPATRRSKEMLVLTSAPGVPRAMLMEQAIAVEALATRRGADWVLMKDCVVNFQTPTLWQRLAGWRSRCQVGRL